MLEEIKTGNRTSVYSALGQVMRRRILSLFYHMLIEDYPRGTRQRLLPIILPKSASNMSLSDLRISRQKSDNHSLSQICQMFHF